MTAIAVPLRIFIATAVVAACASTGAPPGGPDDHAPPQITSISPDSGQTNVNTRAVELKFDEVVSDKPSGATDLDQIFLISPRDGSPNVSWHRSRITVKPRKGFRPNTAYRITMLPGLTDLRGNVRKAGATILFSTGESFPPFSILGRVFDWDAERPANGAYIEAIAKSDTTLVFVAATDTTGQFDVGPLPAGTYTVRALLDANNNRIVDRNEKWDTTTAQVVSTKPVVELDAIERDSVPATFSDVTVNDSVTLHVTFDKPLDPTIVLGPSLIRLQRADSSALRVTGVQWARAFDEAKRQADSVRHADSTRRADTTHRADSAARPARPAPPRVANPPAARPGPPPPKPKAPPPDRAIVVTVSPDSPIEPATTYRITATGLRNLVGNAREITRTFTRAKPVPKDTVKVPVDTAHRPPPHGGRTHGRTR